MGCLLELVGDMVVDVYLEMMCWILPEKKWSEKTRFILEVLVSLFAVLLFICIVFGILLQQQDGEVARTAGRYMAVVPLAIIGVQIIAGIVIRLIVKRKRKNWLDNQ